MLVYVHLTSKVNIDNINYKYFIRFSTKEFIDVRCIDHCVGFIKINNQYFIIDKTNEIDDYNWKILYK